MADAERVVVELLAKVDGFDGKVKQSAAAFGGAMKTVESSADRAERGVARSAAGMQRSLARTQQASRNLGFQISDIGTQIASGTSPFLILAQQGPQVANALEGASGAAGRFAGFLSGPWGAALLAGTSLLGIMIGKYLETGDSIDDLVEKLRKEADEQRRSDAAHAAFNRTLEGQIALQKQLTEELDKQTKSQRQLNAEKVQEVILNAGNLRGKIPGAEDALATARQQQRIASDLLRNPPAGTSPEAMLAIVQTAKDADAAVRAAQGRLDAARASYAAALRNIREAQLPQLQDEVTNSLDGTAKRVTFLKDRLDQLNESYKNGTVAAADYRREAASLQKQIDDLEKSRSSSGTKGDTTKFINPVGSGRISGSFGEQRPGHTHAGVDIAVPVGTNVKAAAGGTVIEAGNLPGYGNVIIVDHGAGTISRYGHLSQILAKRGDSVSQGQVIGLSGGAPGAPGSGNSRGAHLHYEVRVGGKAVDPRKGQFPTDAVAAGSKAQDEIERLADAEADRKRHVASEEASLDAAILRHKQDTAKSADEQYRLQLETIDRTHQRYDAEVDALVAEYERTGGLKGITEADAKILKAKSAQLAQIDRQAAERDEQRRIRQQNLQVATDLIDNNLELLHSEEGLADTQKERRRIALAIVDAEAAKLEATLKSAIAEGEAAGLDQKILDVMRERLANLSAIHSNARKGATEETASPLEKYAGDLQKTADDMDTAFEQIEVEGLEKLIDGIANAIVHFKSLGDVAKAVLQDMAVEIVKVAIKMLLLQALKSIFNVGASSGGGIGSLIHESGHARGGRVGFAPGGLIRGPGTSTSDSIPAITTNGRPIMLSNEEYIIRGAAVRKLGVHTLDQINATGALPMRYAGGGLLGTLTPMNVPAAAGHARGVTVHAPMYVDARGAVMNDRFAREILAESKAYTNKVGATVYTRSLKDAPAAVEKHNRYGR